MTDMTPEQLDAARHKEAVAREGLHLAGVFEIYRELVRTDWRPVNADVLAVREMCAQAIVDEQGDVSWAKDYRNGLYDKSFTVTVALAAYRAGREAGR